MSAVMASWATVPWERSGAANRLGTDRAAGRGAAGPPAQGPPQVTGELECVDAGHCVEDGVAERQRLHVGLAQVRLREPVAGDVEQARADVDAAGYRAALRGQYER